MSFWLYFQHSQISARHVQAQVNTRYLISVIHLERMLLLRRRLILTLFRAEASSMSVEPSSGKPEAEMHAKPASKEEHPQQGQQQLKKEKKAAKAPAASSAPATSGDGLFYRAQLQVRD